MPLDLLTASRCVEPIGISVAPAGYAAAPNGDTADLQGRADRRRWDQDAPARIGRQERYRRGGQNGKSTGKRQPVIPLRSHERLIQAELPRPHEYVANDCQGDGNGNGGP